MDNTSPKYKCEKMGIIMMSTKTCDKRRKKTGFTKGGEVHEECKGCPGPILIEMVKGEGKRGKKEAKTMKTKQTQQKDLGRDPVIRCKTEGCNTIISGNGKTGMCRVCNLKLNQKKALTPEVIKRGAKKRRKRHQERTKLMKENKNDNVMSLDFSDYPELLNSLRATAKDQIRTVEQQILYFVKAGVPGKNGTGPGPEGARTALEP